MAESKAVSVPNYIRSLEALAKRRGFVLGPIVIAQVYVRGGLYTRKVDNLVGEWHGTWRQFLSLKITVPSFRRPLLGGAMIAHSSSPVHAGYLESEGKGVKFLPEFGPVPTGIEHRGEIEIVTYEERVAYHGSSKALIAAGIPRERLILPRKRWWRVGSSVESFGECRWEMRQQPDGSILYVVDTEKAELARNAEHADFLRSVGKHWYFLSDPEPVAKPQRPSYLRLVVDNSRAGCPHA